jgi:two-component system cell cycle sensor histidine kinase/response regulator CckA
VRTRFRDLTLRWKLAILISGLLALFTVLIGIFLPAWLHERAVDAAMERGRTIAELAAFSVSPALMFEDPYAAMELIEAACRADDDVFDVVVRDRANAVVAECGSRRGQERLRQKAALKRAGMLRDIAASIDGGGRKIGTAYVTISLAKAFSDSATTRFLIIAATLSVFCVGVVAVFAISSLVMVPLMRIAETADRIRHGDLSSRAVVEAEDEVGQLARVFNLMVDDLQEARHDLQRLNEQLGYEVDQRTRELKQVLESASDGIISIDGRGHCTLVNRAAAALLVIPRGELASRRFHEVVHPLHHCQTSCPFAVLLADPRGTTIETIFVSGAGMRVKVELSAARIPASDGIVITFRDIGEREAMREKLEQAQRLDSLGALAAGLAHEFNNVLMGISPFLEIIRRKVPANVGVTRTIDTIAQSVKRGKRVTEGVLRFTRTATPNISSVPLDEWAADFCYAARMTIPSNVRLELVVDSELCSMAVDREHLEQVMTNLISNACQAMPRGGTVTIEAGPESGGEWVRIDVSDTGIGMSEAAMAQLFEPFFTSRKKDGHGLGLPIARQLIIANGGTITVESEVGHGTTFHFRLLRAYGTATAPDVPKVEPSRLPRKVLLVEDDEVVADGLLLMLEVHGIATTLLTRGEGVTRAIESDRPDAIILDVGLPDVDGLTVYRQIAARWPDLPVLFSTGHVQSEDLNRSLAAPHVTALLKPYDDAALTGALASIWAAATARLATPA